MGLGDWCGLRHWPLADACTDMARQLKVLDSDSDTVSTVVSPGSSSNTARLELLHSYRRPRSRSQTSQDFTDSSGTVNLGYEASEMESTDSSDVDTRSTVTQTHPKPLQVTPVLTAETAYMNGSLHSQPREKDGTSVRGGTMEGYSIESGKQAWVPPPAEYTPPPCDTPPPARYASPSQSTISKRDNHCSASISSLTAQDEHSHGKKTADKHVEIVVPTRLDNSSNVASLSHTKISISEEHNNNRDLDATRPIVPMPGKIPAALPPSSYRTPPKAPPRRKSVTQIHTVTQNENNVIVPIPGDDAYAEVSETAQDCVHFDEMTTYKSSPPLPLEVELPDYSHTHPEEPKRDDHPLADHLPRWDEITVKEIRENTDTCCSCCLYCFQGKLRKGSGREMWHQCDAYVP